MRQLLKRHSKRQGQGTKRRLLLRRIAPASVGLVVIFGLVSTTISPSKVSADVSYVAGSSNFAGNASSLSLPKPAGTVTGYVMVAQFTYYSNRSATATAPTGWTHISSQYSTNNTYQNVYYKIAAAGEPTSYSFSLSRSAGLAGGIAAFANVSSKTPIDDATGQADTTKSTSVAAPAADATTAGDMQISMWGYAANQTATGYDSGLTQAWAVTNSSNVGIAAAYEALPNAGSTGIVHSTTGTSVAGDAHTVLLKAASAAAGITYVGASTPVTCTSCTSLSPAAPTGWKSGDFFLTSVSWTNGTNLTAPSGWTQIDTTINDGSSSLADFYHFAATGDPSSYTWSFDASSIAVINTVAFSGLDTTTPIDTTANAIDTSNSTTHTAPAVTTNYPEDMLVPIFLYETGTTATAYPATTTAAWNAGTCTSKCHGTNVSSFGGYEVLGAAGSSGTRNTTVGSSSHAIMHTIALKAYLPLVQLISPEANATDTVLSPQFQLVNASLTGTPLEYEIELCSDAACTTILSTIDQTSSQTGWSGQDSNGGTAYAGSTDVSSSTPGTYTPPTPLTAGTSYYWRARSYDTGTSSWSPFSNSALFTTSYVAGVPTLFTPSNADTGVPQQPEFSMAGTDLDQDALEYKVDVCATANCSTILHTFDQTADQTDWSGQDSSNFTAYAADASNAANSTVAYLDYPYTDLSPNATYYWRAYAINPTGSNTWSSASAVNSFTISRGDVRIVSGQIYGSKIL